MPEHARPPFGGKGENEHFYPKKVGTTMLKQSVELNELCTIGLLVTDMKELRFAARCLAILTINAVAKMSKLQVCKWIKNMTGCKNSIHRKAIT